jgi:hypothetical protein
VTGVKPAIAGVPVRIEYVVGEFIGVLYGRLKEVTLLHICDTEPRVIDGRGFTVTVVAVEFAVEQLPLWTTALNCVVCVSAPDVYVVAVLIISVQELNGEIELCHLTTVPLFPDKVSNPLVVPEQIVVPPVTAPPTDKGKIVNEVAVAALSHPLTVCVT